MKKIAFLLVVFIVISATYCSTLKDPINGEEGITPVHVDRLSFVGTTSIYDQKKKYSLLSFEQRKQLWLSKFYQLKERNIIPPRLITELITQLEPIKSKSELESHEGIRNSVVEIAKIVPEDAFIQMFFVLKDFNRTFVQKDIPDEIFINEIQSEFDIFSRAEQRPISTPGLEECNCNWQCGDPSTVGTSSTCEPTTNCGFFWMFMCYERDNF